MAECKDNNSNEDKKKLDKWEHPCVKSVVKTLGIPEIYGDKTFLNARKAIDYRSLNLTTNQMKCFSEVILGRRAKYRTMSRFEIIMWVIMETPRRDAE